MNVSESRKIHIIALPQGTPLKVVMSEDQSSAIDAEAGGFRRCFGHLGFLSSCL